MAFEIKFSKFDNTPWGFRLTGGNDCGMPLTVVKVSKGSLAESFGLKDNDNIIKINEKDTTSLTHDEAHEVILLAGNNFVATVFRNENAVATSCPISTFTETTPLTNGVDQVPIYDAKVTSMIYKLYPDSDATPIENSQIPLPKHVDEFRTINQQEWKKMSSKHIQSSSENHLSSSYNQNSSIKKNMCNGHEIDIKSIEQHSRGIESLEAISNTVKDQSKELDVSKKIVVDKKSTSVNKNESINALKIEEVKNVNKGSFNNKIKFETTNDHITLDEAKIGAINAANVLSEKSKLSRKSSIEETRMDTVNAFKMISEGMKHKCFAVPCEVSKLQTKSQTDMLLKTFFIHLTDVMVALTQMIMSEDDNKSCSCSCGPNCVCLKKNNEVALSQNNNMIIKEIPEKKQIVVNENSVIQKMNKSEEKSTTLVANECNITKKLDNIEENNAISVKEETAVNESNIIQKTENLEEKNALSVEKEIVINESNIIQKMENMEEKNALSVEKEIVVNESNVTQKIENQEENNVLLIKKEIAKNESNIIQKMENIEEETSSFTEKVLENQSEISKTNNTEVVLKEVIQNIQTATGVDVTVNGKDPLEWLADLDEQHKNDSPCEFKRKVENESIIVESKMENRSFTSQTIQNIKEKIDTQASLTDVKESKEKSDGLKKLEINEINKTNIIDESNVKPSWDIKVIPTVPQTPNTEEYLFRLNVKLKGKLSDYPETSPEEIPVESKPIVIEKKTLPKRPIFSLGDIKIESSVVQPNEVTKLETETALNSIIESAEKSAQESLDKADKTINETVVNKLIAEESCAVAYNKTASTNEKCPNASELKDNNYNNTDNINSPALASANNSVDVEFTNNDNIICTNVETSKSYTNASISSCKNEASATNNSDSTLSATFTSIVPDSSSSICTFPASASGNVSTISATTNNHDSLINYAIEQRGQEHETIISQSKEKNIEVENTYTKSTEESSSTISEKTEIAQTKVAQNGIAQTETVQNGIAQHEISQTGITQNGISQIEKSTEEFSQESSVSIEDVTAESAPLAKTMGELSKGFATIENNIQNLSNGFESTFNNTSNMYMEQDIGKPGLPDQEINEILTGSAKIMKDQHVIGLQKVLASHMHRPDDEINTTEIKDMTPMVAFLKDSEVFKALNEESLKKKAEKIQEDRKKYTTFLQKPSRPVPFCKRIAELLTFEEAPYKVNIKKQPRKDSKDFSSNILTEGVFLIPEVPILIPEPSPEYYEAPEYLADSSFPDLEDTGIPIPSKPVEEVDDVKSEEISSESNIVENEQHIEEIESTIPKQTEDSISMIINDNIDESMSMEEQLINVQRQLVALSKLPATIQQTLDEVTKQLSKMVPASEREIIESIVQNKTEVTEENNTQSIASKENVNLEINGENHDDTINNNESEINTESTINNNESNTNNECNESNGNKENNESITNNENKDESTNINSEKNNESNGTEIKCEASVSIEEKKNINTTNGEKNIDKLRKDLIYELNEEHAMRQVKQRPGGRVGRPKPAFGPLVPQERPIVLPGGRKWKAPRDALTDSFIAETLSGQAELIMGKALGNHFENIYSPNVERVNFMKYSKPPKTLDHLKNSSVFKLVHDMEEPAHGIYDRPSMVMAESEFREKCRSITPNSFNGKEYNGNISVEAES